LSKKKSPEKKSSPENSQKRIGEQASFVLLTRRPAGCSTPVGSAGHELTQMSFNSRVNSVIVSFEFDLIHYLRKL